MAGRLFHLSEGYFTYPSKMSINTFKMAVILFSYLFFSRLVMFSNSWCCHCFAAISFSLSSLSVSAHQHTQKHTRPKPWRITLNPYFYSILAVLQKCDLWGDLFCSCACTLRDLWSCALQSAVSHPNDFWGRCIFAFFYTVFTKLATKLSHVFIMPFHFCTMCLGDTTESSEMSQELSYTKDSVPHASLLPRQSVFTCLGFIISPYCHSL